MLPDIPVFLHLCQESRTEAMKKYKLFCFDLSQSMKKGRWPTVRTQIFFSPSQDILRIEYRIVKQNQRMPSQIVQFLDQVQNVALHTHSFPEHTASLLLGISRCENIKYLLVLSPWTGQYIRYDVTKGGRTQAAVELPEWEEEMKRGEAMNSDEEWKLNSEDTRLRLSSME